MPFSDVLHAALSSVRKPLQIFTLWNMLFCTCITILLPLLRCQWCLPLLTWLLVTSKLASVQAKISLINGRNLSWHSRCMTVLPSSFCMAKDAVSVSTQEKKWDQDFLESAAKRGRWNNEMCAIQEQKCSQIPTYHSFVASTCQPWSKDTPRKSPPWGLCWKVCSRRHAVVCCHACPLSAGRSASATPPSSTSHRPHVGKHCAVGAQHSVSQSVHLAHWCCKGWHHALAARAGRQRDL